MKLDGGQKKLLAVLLVVIVVIGGFFFWFEQKKTKELAQQKKAREEARQEQMAQVTIMGAPEVAQDRMVAYIKRRNPNTKLNCSVEELVAYYYAEGGLEGVRPDIALCQAIKETGCWAYGGDVTPEQNNYCGLGATGKKNPGASFATPQLGVRAHIQHLMVYATKDRPKYDIVDPRYEIVIEKHPEIYGQVTTWVGLNGKWAVPGKNYGQEILEILEKVQ